MYVAAVVLSIKVPHRDQLISTGSSTVAFPPAGQGSVLSAFFIIQLAMIQLFNL